MSLEKEMAIHSTILAWRIPWTEEPGGLQVLDTWTEVGGKCTVHGLQESDTTKPPPPLQ